MARSNKKKRSPPPTPSHSPPPASEPVNPPAPAPRPARSNSIIDLTEDSLIENNPAPSNPTQTANDNNIKKITDDEVDDFPARRTRLQVKLQQSQNPFFGSSAGSNSSSGTRSRSKSGSTSGPSNNNTNVDISTDVSNKPKGKKRIRLAPEVVIPTSTSSSIMKNSVGPSTSPAKASGSRSSFITDIVVPKSTSKSDSRLEQPLTTSSSSASGNGSASKQTPIKSVNGTSYAKIVYPNPLSSAIPSSSAAAVETPSSSYLHAQTSSSSSSKPPATPSATGSSSTSNSKHKSILPDPSIPAAPPQFSLLKVNHNHQDIEAECIICSEELSEILVKAEKLGKGGLGGGLSLWSCELAGCGALFCIECAMACIERSTSKSEKPICPACTREWSIQEIKDQAKAYDPLAYSGTIPNQASATNAAPSAALNAIPDSASNLIPAPVPRPVPINASTIINPGSTLASSGSSVPPQPASKSSRIGAQPQPASGSSRILEAAQPTSSSSRAVPAPQLNLGSSTISNASRPAWAIEHSPFRGERRKRIPFSYSQNPFLIPQLGRPSAPLLVQAPPNLDQDQGFITIRGRTGGSSSTAVQNALKSSNGTGSQIVLNGINRYV